MNLVQLLFVLFFSTFVMGGCNSTPHQEGSFPGECSDGIDNDGDGEYDCNDVNCAGAPVCNDISDPSDEEIEENEESVCGNGEVEEGEVCDDGNTVSGDYCSFNCQAVSGSCGDGVVQTNEVCDDGNSLDTDYCFSDCQNVIGSCGDGVIQTNEVCDDGNTSENDYCSDNCLSVTGSCGDSVKQDNEVCDDGNLLDDDYCASDCQGIIGMCGDGIVQAIETCDDGNSESGDYCSSDCLSFTSVCGDGLIELNEVCDDGNSASGDYCSGDCLSETSICGDFYVGPGESCESDRPCSALHSGLSSGMARCEDNCRRLDYSECIGLPAGMVPVPEGSFWMGCNSEVDDQCEDDESPYHEVYLDAFYIDAYEVTAVAYKSCVDAGACSYSGGTGPGHTYNNGRDNHPINYVSHTEAGIYCSWLGKRLPTEAEWEKAARGTNGRVYPWGNSPVVSCTHAVMSEGADGCGTDETWEVGSKLSGVSLYGVYDMLGNVLEFTSDRYKSTYYVSNPGFEWVNPTGPSYGQFRTARGASYLSEDIGTLRLSNRTFLNTYTRSASGGFRCVQ